MIVDASVWVSYLIPLPLQPSPVLTTARCWSTALDPLSPNV